MPAAFVTRQHEHAHKAPAASQKIQYPFWFGGSASCFAAAVTHPLDLVKVRLQTRTADGPKKMTAMFGHIIREDGIHGLYRGLSASLLRQMTYSTTRFGVYEKLKQYFTPAAATSSTQQPPLATLIAMSAASGFLGGLVGNPADVMNVRMQHDSSLPQEKRRNYRNAIEGIIRMRREEGIGALFRGVWPNSARASLMTASQLASYDEIKSTLIARAGMKDDLTTHFTASILAGFIATTVCSPVDVLKTRLMSAQSKETVAALLARVTREEGAAWMFKGWVPSFIRLGPHTVATFLFLEQHKKIYRQMFVAVDP